jgi:tetratricopeptide (TPR) repeat protein
MNSTKFKMHNFRNEIQKTCFLVYSTRETHLDKVIDRLTDFLSNDLNFSVIKLGEARVSGTQLLPDILKYTKECDMGIVILDGLRPNVVLELGMILANETPCIILVERNAKINIASFVNDNGQKSKSVPKIKIDVLKHISDISNICWNEYSLEDDTRFRSLIRNQVRKLQSRMHKRKSHNDHRYTKQMSSLLKRIDASDKVSAKKHFQLMLAVHKEMKALPKDQIAHAFFHIGLSFFRRKEYQTALREVVDGLAIRPKYHQLLGLKGRILCFLGQRNEGLQILKTIHSKNPNNKYFLYYYLDALILNKNPKLALKILSKMTYERLLIDNLIPIKARALFIDGQVVKSLELLIEMYEYDLNNWAIHHVMHLINNEIRETLPKKIVLLIEKCVRRALERNQIRCYKCFSSACNAIGLKELSKRLFILRAKKEKDNNPDAINELAFNFIKFGEYKFAGDILRAAIKKFPDHAYLNATWGLYNLKSENNLSAGKKFYAKAIDLRPSDMPLRRMFFYQLGKFYRSRDNKLEAKKSYQAALDVQTDHLQSEIQQELLSMRKK